MPLFWLCLTFIAGVLFSSILSLPDYLCPFLLVLSSFGAWLEYKFSDKQSHILLSRPLFRIPFSLLVAALALGGWCYQAALPEFTQQDLAWYSSSEEVSVTGTVISFPEESSSSTVAIIQASSIKITGIEIPIQGKLELRLPGGFSLSYGEVLRLEGKLSAVIDSNEEPYTSYLARKGIYSRMHYPQITTTAYDAGNPFLSAIYRLREHALVTIFSQIPQPESSLLAGILLGIDWVIPNYIQDAYNACGVLHIIAISGFNISLISGLIIRLTRLVLTPAKAGAAAIAVIIFYTLLVGAEPAVVRAAIMGSLAIPAHYIGRRVIALHSLTIVAVIMLIGNPFLLWDISFQLSFLACLGLITMVDPIQKWTSKFISARFSESISNRLMPALSMIIATLVAQFSVLPVSLKLSSQLSVLSLPANLALAPVQSIIMSLGGISIFLSLFSPTLGQFFARAAWPFLAYCNRAAMYFGFHSNAEISSPSNPLFPRLVLIIVSASLLFFSILQIHNLTRPEKE